MSSCAYCASYPSIHLLGLGLVLLNSFPQDGYDAFPLFALLVELLLLLLWLGLAAGKKRHKNQGVREISNDFTRLTIISQRIVLCCFYLSSFFGELGIVIHDLQVVKLLSMLQDLCFQTVQLALVSQTLLLKSWMCKSEGRERKYVQKEWKRSQMC